MNIVKKTITMGDGTIVEIETGKLAKQAAGSVVVKVGGTGDCHMCKGRQGGCGFHASVGGV